jgi:hypothetical protein
MKKYAILVLLAASTLSYGSGPGTAPAAQRNMLGERNPSTTNDPCQAPSVVGCGPCFKACMAQQHGEGQKDLNSPNRGRPNSRQGATRQ